MENRQLCPKCGGSGVVYHVEKITDGYRVEVDTCHVCRGTGSVTVAITNGDRIRAMSDKELAEFLANPCQCDIDPAKDGYRECGNDLCLKYTRLAPAASGGGHLMGSENLIDRLYAKQQSYNSYTDSEFAHVIEDAITALSKLQAENEKLRAELDEKEKYYDQMIDALSATDSAELEQVKLAARNDIPHNCHTCMDKSNPTCPGNKRTNSFGYQENCEKWTWRGPQKED